MTDQTNRLTTHTRTPLSLMLTPWRGQCTLQLLLLPALAVLGIAVLAIAGTANAQEPTQQPKPKPNVLFLAVDDMKDWVACLGGYEGTVHTPNIDRLAKRGVLFTNAHCPSPKCAPSRAAIMTGLRPSTTGLYDNGHWWKPNFPDLVTMPVHFRDHGYHVVGAGKIFHHTAGNNPPNQWHDFKRLTFQNDPWFRSNKLNYPWSRTTANPAGFPFSKLEDLPHENDWGAIPIDDEQHDDVLIANYAIDVLQTQQSKPFFLACGIFRPHLPWYVPQKFFDLYPLQDVQLPPTKTDDLDDIPKGGQRFAAARRSDLKTIEGSGKARHAVQAYLASISFADSLIGRVLDALDQGPHANNTIVVLWSDHGWHLGEKRHWHKSTLWEEATRIPFVISVPGGEVGHSPMPVNLIDLFPTLNELCELPAIESHDGQSVVPLLEQPSMSWEQWGRPSITEFRKGNIAVRSQRYRYIRYDDGGEELYDHSTDPQEWHNLAADPKHSHVIEELKRWLPDEWANERPTKSRFAFEPSTYTWRDKKTGQVTRGQ